MTQEEKAKHYDKAIERAESLLSGNQLGNAWIYKLLPELKESEDEKIRKDIIVYLQYSMAFDKSFLDKKYNWSQKDCSKWIDWLEKQGEQKDTYQLNNLKSNIKFLFKAKVKSSGKIVIIHDGQLSLDGEEWINYQSDAKDGYKVYEPNNLELVCETEQKPAEEYNITGIGSKHAQGKLGEMIKNLKSADKVEPKFKVGQTIKKEGFNLGFTIVKTEDGFYYNDMGDYFPFTDQDNWELVEQNPAWSEEDERMLSDIVKDLVHPWNEYIPDRIEDEIKWLKNRLKSLRPQNWTKEDKERYISCLQRLGTGDPKQPETINSKWFKEHVYPQTTWKPSDEQMKALADALGLAKNCGEEIAFDLRTLYEQLKKLKEK